MQFIETSFQYELLLVFSIFMENLKRTHLKSCCDRIFTIAKIVGCDSVLNLIHRYFIAVGLKNVLDFLFPYKAWKINKQTNKQTSKQNLENPFVQCIATKCPLFIPKLDHSNKCFRIKEKGISSVKGNWQFEKKYNYLKNATTWSLVIYTILQSVVSVAI